jgi:hypothetical protein
LELCRSQARFERLGDLLASDILKRGANEEVSSINVEDTNGPYERSPNAATAKKRSIPYSTSEEAKAGGCMGLSLKGCTMLTMFSYGSHLFLLGVKVLSTWSLSEPSLAAKTSSIELQALESM